jgi:putative flippase GtrA
MAVPDAQEEAKGSLAVESAARPVAFIAVGSAAFAVHFLIVSALVPFGPRPLLANVVGFLGAFGVSFLGHERWSFPARRRDRARAMRRFFIVAACGFAFNELLYAMLLGLTELGFRLALFLVLVLTAVSTFLLSRYWAFAYAD